MEFEQLLEKAIITVEENWGRELTDKEKNVFEAAYAKGFIDGNGVLLDVFKTIK